MDYAAWPGMVDMIEGWFNQPIPAKTATMWYAELRHYDADRVAEAFGRVARKHQSPYLPPLGLVLQSIRHDGRATPIALLPERFTRSTDQFLLTEGGANEEGDNDDGYFAGGLICGSPGCGYTPVLASTTTCPEHGGQFVPDGHVLASGQGVTAA